MLYAPGTLRAAGLRTGREVEVFELTTAEPPAKLRLTPARTDLRADGQDLGFVTLEVVDAGGRVVPQAELPVRVALEGPAVIAGIGSGDLTSRESYRANPHRLYQGRGIVVIRTDARAGRITLTATATGTGPAEIALTSSPTSCIGRRQTHDIR